jgi:PEGA domain
MKSITKTFPLLVAAFLLAWSAPVDAMSLHARFVVVPHGYYFARPSYFDPWWSPYSPWGPYPYAVFHIGVTKPSADLKIEVTPKQAGIYIDGYYAGPAADFEGVLKRLHTTPGGHEVTLYLDGYRTVTQNIYVRPDSTFDLRETLDKLAAGETSAQPPAPLERK